MFFDINNQMINEYLILVNEVSKRNKIIEQWITPPLNVLGVFNIVSQVATDNQHDTIGLHTHMAWFHPQMTYLPRKLQTNFLTYFSHFLPPLMQIAHLHTHLHYTFTIESFHSTSPCAIASSNVKCTLHTFNIDTCL